MNFNLNHDELSLFAQIVKSSTCRDNHGMIFPTTIFQNTNVAQLKWAKTKCKPDRDTLVVDIPSNRKSTEGKTPPYAGTTKSRKPLL